MIVHSEVCVVTTELTVASLEHISPGLCFLSFMLISCVSFPPLPTLGFYTFYIMDDMSSVIHDAQMLNLRILCFSLFYIIVIGIYLCFGLLVVQNKQFKVFAWVVGNSDG